MMKFISSLQPEELLKSIKLMVTYLKYLLFVLLSCATLHGENYSYSDLLKSCDTEQTTAILESRSFLGLDEETQFQSLKGGLTSAKVYSFDFEGKKCVLRFLAPHHSPEMRNNEILALNIGHKLGIAPPCIFSDRNAVLMVIPFIEGDALNHPLDHQLVQLGKMVRTLHNYSDFYPTRYTLNDRMELHYKKGVNTGIAYPTGFHQEVQSILSTPCPRTAVPCHGDLNPSNILVNASNSISLIDWTTATLDDPFADLGYFCLLSNLSPAQEKVFLEAYFGRTPMVEEYEMLREEKARVSLLTATLWLRFSETAEERTFPIAARVSALDDELRSTTLKEVHEYLQEGIVVDLNSAPKSEIKSYALSFYKAYLKLVRRCPSFDGTYTQTHSKF